jgi:hypothetical protein
MEKSIGLTGSTEVDTNILKTIPKSKIDAKHLIDEAILVSVESLVEVMKKNRREAEVQMRGCSAIGEMAQHCVRRRIISKGAFNEVQVARFAGQSDMMELIKAGTMKAVLDAIDVHSDDRFVVLRGLWALEHMCCSPEIKAEMNEMGGSQTIALCYFKYKKDEEICDIIVRINPAYKVNEVCCVLV